MRTSKVNFNGPSGAFLSPAEPLLRDTQLISVDISATTGSDKNFTYSENFDTSCHPIEGEEFLKLRACFRRSIQMSRALGLSQLGNWNITLLYGDFRGKETRVTLTEHGVMLDLTHLTPVDHENDLEI